MNTIDNSSVRPDTQDTRDFIKESSSSVDTSTHVDLLHGIDYKVRNQGNLSACTGYASTNFISILNSKLTHLWTTYDPYFSWYNGRKEEGTLGKNIGVMPRTVMRVMCSKGTLPECFSSMKSSTSEPNEKDYRWAEKIKIKSYFKIPENDKIKVFQHTLINERLPIFTCINLYSGSWNRCNFNGVLEYSNDFKNDKKTGSHAVVVYGWDPSENKFLALNSHGEGFGKNGSFLISPEYVEKDSWDNWTVGYDYF